MNPTDDHLHTGDDERIDLLVDGELPEAERRNLLSTLDDLPDGWRRCALAFLESQSWANEMRAIPCEQTAEPHATPAPGRGKAPFGFWGTLAAMAACFLIALGLGSLLRGVWAPEGSGGTTPIELADTANVREEPRTESDEAESLPSPDVPAESWKLVTLPLEDGRGGAVESIQVPAVERERFDAQWFEEFPTATMPAELLHALRRSGHRVFRNRQLIPVPIDGGRQLVVPVDEIEVRYVGNSSYQ
jgi:hypothetical protein